MDTTKQKDKRKKQIHDGPIPAETVGKMVANHQSKTGIGAHALFLGQVRADTIDGKQVTGIEYSCYEAMAEDVLHNIKESAFEKFELNCLHIKHSVGLVKVGEISLLVMVSSPHRKSSFEASEWIVEEIKKKAPFWKKEMLEGGGSHWVDGAPPA